MDSDEGDDCFYGDDEFEDFSDHKSDEDRSDNVNIEHDIPIADDNINLIAKKPYTILNEAEIKRRQDEEISYVSSVLSLSIAESTVLLCHYNWSNITQLNDEWFANEKNVRTKVGLLTNTTTNTIDNTTCGICFDDEFARDELFSASCGHEFCQTCWGHYIDMSINEKGSGSLLLRCPEPKCNATVDRDMMTKLASEETGLKYLGYMIRSYVEFKKLKAKWCPAPGCNNAVEFDDLGTGDVFDVLCDCSHEFCFNCGEEPHRPVECKIVHEWILKNNSEAENVKWILAFCKPCPQCKRPIEKNTGCNHMTCRPPCGHAFCWHCGRSLHGIAGYSCNCNGYRSSSKPINDEKSQRELAKRSIERYSHYYERWAGNNRSRDKALADLAEIKKDKIPFLVDNLKLKNEYDLSFIFKAWEQIVECRRVLKWTYAYGYFMPEHENSKRQLFEYLQGEAEVALERLHSCAERELSVYYDDKRGNDAFDDFRVFQARLIQLTVVTGKFFKNLVDGLEQGLTEVWIEPKRVEPARKRKSGSSSTELPEPEYWNCDRCSYLNPSFAFTCAVCFESD